MPRPRIPIPHGVIQLVFRSISLAIDIAGLALFTTLAVRWRSREQTHGASLVTMATAILIDFSEVVWLADFSHRIPRTTCCGAGVIDFLIVSVGVLSMPLMALANDRRDDYNGTLDPLPYEGTVDVAFDVTIVVICFHAVFCLYGIVLSVVAIQDQSRRVKRQQGQSDQTERNQETGTRLGDIPGVPSRQPVYA
ncbi:hypothetical protein DL98DRAFT_593362 [Cadophora sp. DSE1049]|nr:hypothetical protein DL98DRAFT_593362 [Cadophora sp. DSE1049]